MLRCHRLRLEPFFSLNTVSLTRTRTRECYSYPFVLLFSTTSESDRRSFTISYLTNTCAFSPEAALRTSKRLRFDTAHKPESVISFFRTHGFSTSQIHNILAREPELLVCDPIQRVLPKFQFLASKGASPSDLVLMVTRSPRFLRISLDNLIINAYQLVRTFCSSDHKAVAILLACPIAVGDPRVVSNVKMLIEAGVTHSSIYHLFRTRPSVLCSASLSKSVEEVKGLGFCPSRFNFGVALLAKRAVPKSLWDAKVYAFKRWGWSEDEVLLAFKKEPSLMLRSTDKINAVLSFWIGQLGWDRSPLIIAPVIFGFSLDKRLIPRASVVQHLLYSGLMKKRASLVYPFALSDRLFLKKFVECFEEETSSRLLKLYLGQQGC
ncbi:hypothetical protein VNO77_05745 [Canavalia gladiata]|uniref:mTERF protein n=1 Tax=Canavalia gladiata TaxID=3824 RepID=A0AAN9MZM7_CANGL